MEYFWAPPPYAFDAKGAKQLLVEAGYPNGFDAGDLTGDTIYGVAIGEPVANYLQQVGIRVRLRPMERVAFFKEYGEKKLRGVIFSGSGAPGNAPSRASSSTRSPAAATPTAPIPTWTASTPSRSTR